MANDSELTLSKRLTYTIRWDSQSSVYRAHCHELADVDTVSDSPEGALAAAYYAVAEGLRFLGLGQPDFLEPYSSNVLYELGPVRNALHIASRQSDDSGELRSALLVMISRHCQQFIARGGTVDELAVEFGLTLTNAEGLLKGRWPEAKSSASEHGQSE